MSVTQAISIQTAEAVAASPDVGRTARRDAFAPVVFAIHLVEAVAAGIIYPNARLDPDLLAHFMYFRHWVTGDRSLYGVGYFTHPKPLLVFTLGALDDVTAAFLCSAIAGALLATLLYLVCRDALGRTVALLTSTIMLADAVRIHLVVGSGADMYIGLFLFAAMYLVTVERPLFAALALLCAGLIKPVAVPCGLYFIAAHPRDRRSWLYAAIPAVSIPLTLLSNRICLGSALGSSAFLAHFAAMRDGITIGVADVPHYVLWTQLARNRFLSTMSWGPIGMLLWLRADRRRLTSAMLLMPLLFLLGYMLLAVPSRYMPFFRFYWPFQAWFLGFLVYGIVESARRLAPTAPRLRVALTGLLLAFVTQGYCQLLLQYHQRLMVPFEHAMTFAEQSEAILVHSPAPTTEDIVIPLGTLSYFMWALEADGARYTVHTAEGLAIDDDTKRPQWILDFPILFISKRGRAYAHRVIDGGGYAVRLQTAEGRLALRSSP